MWFHCKTMAPILIFVVVRFFLTYLWTFYCIELWIKFWYLMMQLHILIQKCFKSISAAVFEVCASSLLKLYSLFNSSATLVATNNSIVNKKPNIYFRSYHFWEGSLDSGSLFWRPRLSRGPSKIYFYFETSRWSKRNLFLHLVMFFLDNLLIKYRFFYTFV
jgi:hypothetical protein